MPEPEPRSEPLRRVLTYEDFEPHVGEDFVLRGQDGLPDFVFNLIAAKLTRNLLPPTMRPPFRLSFRVAQDHEPQQGMYLLSHAALGDVALFLVPSKKDADGVEYCSSFA